MDEDFKTYQLYFERNDYHLNVQVRFFIEENSTFREVNRYDNVCFDFSGLLPVMKKGAYSSESFIIDNKSDKKGVVTFNMRSNGFFYFFGDKRIKMTISVTDNAFHSSNTIETPPFKLREI
jgi:hypothetical protein